MTPRLLVLDTETTGTGDDARIVEIAFFEIDENLNVLGRYESLIDPQMPISFGAMGVHNITQAMVADAPTMDEYLNQVLPVNIFREPFILIAHNAKFDAGRVKPYAPGLQETFCSLREAQRYLPDAENHKLTTLKYQFDLHADGGDAHRALADVAVLHNLLKLLTRVSGKTLTELRRDHNEPVLVRKLGFGKHIGKAPDEADTGWIEWALKNVKDEKMTSDLRWTLNKVLESRGRQPIL